MLQCRKSKWKISYAKQPVPRVTQSGNNVSTCIETFIDGGCKNRNLWVMPSNAANSFRCCDQIDDADITGFEIGQKIKRGYGAAAGGQHRIDQDYLKLA